MAESVACPICGLPLKPAGGTWLSAFECSRCGPFTDFKTLSSELQRRHPVRFPEPPDTKPQDSES